MPVRALTNDDWGFDTNCFVCEPRNDAGLRIPFFHDTEHDCVIANFELDDRFSGAPTWAHGGVSLAICDEAMAWAVIAIHHKWAVTKTSSAEFERPVVVGQQYRCVASIERIDGDLVHTIARIERPDSAKISVRTTAVMSILTAVQAPAMGIDLADGHRDYLRP